MIGNGKLLINRKKFFKNKGYRIKVAKNSYILFEKEEDYLNIFYLEKVLFDFNKNLLYKQDKDLRLRLNFRLSLIEKYIDSLPKFNIKILYDESKFENPFEIKFPNISCLGKWYDDVEDYLDKISELEDKFLEDKYIEFYEIMDELISIQYYKRKYITKDCYDKFTKYDLKWEVYDTDSNSD